MTTQWISQSGLYVPASARKPTAIDLFCGCGGMSLGLIQAGFEVLAGVDNDPYAAMTYMVNLGSYPVNIVYCEPQDKDRLNKAVGQCIKTDAKTGLAKLPVSGSGWIKDSEYPPVRNFFFGDIRKLSGEDVLDVLGMKVGELDLVCGGPPCQGFSYAGRRNVMDPRNSLVFEFARLVLEIWPKAIMMENVPGILDMVTPDGLPVMDAFCRILEDGGFGAVDALKRSLLATSGAGAALRSKSVTKSSQEKLPAPAQLAMF